MTILLCSAVGAGWAAALLGVAYLIFIAHQEQIRTLKMSDAKPEK
jgi:hypothetical protein